MKDIIEELNDVAASLSEKGHVSAASVALAAIDEIQRLRDRQEQIDRVLADLRARIVNIAEMIEDKEGPL